MRVWAALSSLLLAGCSSTLSGAPDDGAALGPDAGFTGNACPQVEVALSSVTPTVMLLIDRSGTMNQGFSGLSRYAAVYQTLFDPSAGAVTQLDSQVRFGLATYTGQDGNPTCPIINSMAPQLGSGALLRDAYASLPPVEDTPTGESISAVSSQLATYAEPGPKIIVLATDGEPDSCADPDPDGQPAAKALAVSAAAQAHQMGIDTFVISVGSDVSADHLQDMANAGVGLPVDGPQNAPYYQALNPDQLVDAFDTIIGGVRNCTFAIDEEVDPSGAASGVVLLDGSPLTYGIDWDLANPTTLRLLGGACQTVQGGGNHSLSASFDCNAISIE